MLPSSSLQTWFLFAFLASLTILYTPVHAKKAVFDFSMFEKLLSERRPVITIVVAVYNLESNWRSIFAEAAEMLEDEQIVFVEAERRLYPTFFVSKEHGAFGPTEEGLLIYTPQKEFERRPVPDHPYSLGLTLTAYLPKKGGSSCSVNKKSVPVGPVPVGMDLTDGEVFERYMLFGKPIAFVFVDYEDPAMMASFQQDILPLLKNLGTEMKDEMLFGYIDINRFRRYFRLLMGGADGKSSLPQLVVQKLPEHWHYPFRGNLVESELRSFVRGVLDGSVSPNLRSEENRDSYEVQESAAIVLKLTGSTFEDFVKPGLSDIVVKAYTPRCPHCRAIAETYRDLAEFVHDSGVVGQETLRFAEIDVAANDIPGVFVPFVPRLFMFPHGDGSLMVEYEGSFDGLDLFQDLLEWVQDNAAASRDVLEEIVGVLVGVSEDDDDDEVEDLWDEL